MPSSDEGNRRLSTAEKASPGATIFTIGLSLLALFFWFLALATLADLNGSDAAGNGLAQAYGAVEIVIVWLLLAIVAAAVKGAVPKLAAVAALILIPEPASWRCTRWSCCRILMFRPFSGPSSSRPQYRR
jgi:hypothetical protein